MSGRQVWKTALTRLCTLAHGMPGHVTAPGSHANCILLATRAGDCLSCWGVDVTQAER